MQVVAAGPGSVIISIDYAANGTDWARLFDSSLIGWCVDETGAAESLPAIIGQLPPVAADTGAVMSPQWAQFTDPAVFVPDVWRGNFPDFLTWLATNNGATRPLDARFGVSHSLLNGWSAWAAANPSLVYKPPEDDGGTTFAVGKRGGHAARSAPARGRD
jgi:hypothetical protein